THATSSIEDFAIVRLGPAGNKDGSFGTGGKVLTSFGSGNLAFAYGMALQPNGKIVLSGVDKNSQGDGAVAVARYTSGGALDTTFSGDGKVTTQITMGWDAAWRVAIQSDGKIV